MQHDAPVEWRPTETRHHPVVQELDAVLNPIKYPGAKLDGILADVQAIFQENGLQREKAVAISNHVKALAAEARR